MRNAIWGLVSVSVVMLFGAIVSLDGAGGDKGSVWKPAIPEAAFQELVRRSAKLIDENLAKSGEDEIKRAQAHAVIIASYAQSSQVDPGVASGIKSTALDLARMVTFKDKINDAKKVAMALGKLQINAKAKPEGDMKTLVDEVIQIMDTYRTKSKGGDGIHADLQVNPRLKTALNGIEEKIRMIAAKKLTDANLDKAAKELEMLGYREAAMGSLVHGYAPAKKIGTKDPDEWRQFSLAMRDAGIALAQAAAKKDGDGVLTASNRLNSACNQCHTAFRGQ